MDTALLEQIGLNLTQAKAYLALISSGRLTPPELATKIQITRTNAYEVLKQLTELGLAIKLTPTKTENDSKTPAKATYRPTNPASLESLMEHRRNTVIEQETRLRNLMPQLMTYFYTFSEQPGVRFYQGKDSLIKVYEDMLRTRQPIYLLRTTADDQYLGLDFYDRFRRERAKLGITTIALTPDVPEVNHDPVIDTQYHFQRTWFDPSLYTAPVEWDIYGDKVAILSFGQEAMATIIESPEIASAMRQMFGIMRQGLTQPIPSSPVPPQSHPNNSHTYEPNTPPAPPESFA